MKTTGVKAVIFREQNQYVARCPETGVTVRADTPAEAVEVLAAAVADFLEEKRLVELVEFL